MMMHDEWYMNVSIKCINSSIRTFSAFISMRISYNDRRIHPFLGSLPSPLCTAKSQTDHFSECQEGGQFEDSPKPDRVSRNEATDRPGWSERDSVDRSLFRERIGDRLDS